MGAQHAFKEFAYDSKVYMPVLPHTFIAITADERRSGKQRWTPDKYVVQVLHLAEEYRLLSAEHTSVVTSILSIPYNISKFT